MSVKLTFTVLFFLCTVAYSLTQPDLQDEGFTIPELPNPDPKATPALLLPSQNPETEPASEIKYPVEVEIDEQTELGSSSTEVKTESTETVAPLTVVTFRPTNLQFLPQRPLLPFRHRHRCHHGHRMMKPRFYGNDMIVSGEKDVGSELGEHQERRGVDRQIPARWTRFHHGGHRFSLYDDVANGEEREWGPKRHHEHHHEEKHEHEHEHGHEPEHEDDQEHEHEDDQEHEHEHEHGHEPEHEDDQEHEHEHEHGHEPEHEDDQEHEHEHGHGHDHEHEDDQEHEPEHEHEHEPEHEHDHEHAHEHEHEPEHEHGHGHGHEHGHGHGYDQEHGHEHEWGLFKGIRKFLEHDF